MTQGEILTLMEQYKGIRFTSKQIASILCKNLVSVNRCLASLNKGNFIEVSHQHKDTYKARKYWVD